MLPKIELPTFTITVPSTNKTITLRPMTVKEEKILLIAKQSETDEDTIKAMVQVIGNCVQDSVQIGKLKYYDIEWIFLQLRKQSVSNKVKYELEGKEVEVDLGDVQPPEKGEAKIIELPNDIKLEMTYPDIQVYYSPEYIKANDDNKFNIILRNSMKKIYHGDKIIETKNYNLDEIKEFVDSIPSRNFEEINSFFASQPNLYYKINDEVELKSIFDFFTF